MTGNHTAGRAVPTRQRLGVATGFLERPNRRRLTITTDDATFDALVRAVRPGETVSAAMRRLLMAVLGQ